MNSRPWRIAVTGAAGFVGSVFLRHVAELDMPGIEAVSIFGSAAGDVRDFGQVSQAIAAMRPDVVLHLAAIAAPSAARADPSEAWHVNVMGTLHIAQAIREQSPKTRLLFVGSSEAYGGSFLTSPSPIAETAALLPRNTYAATKAAADLMIGQMSVDGLNAIRFRPFNHSGPGQTPDYVLPAFAQQVAWIEKGQQPRSSMSATSMPNAISSTFVTLFTPIFGLRSRRRRFRWALCSTLRQAIPCASGRY